MDTIGLYQASMGTFLLRNSNANGTADTTFVFGPTGTNMKPIAGDWNNDGFDTIGVYDSSTGQASSGTYSLRNSNTAGAPDLSFVFGGGGGVPLAGDWDGVSGDSIGFYVPSTSAFHLKNANAGGEGDYNFIYGNANSAPLAGDWNGVSGGGDPQSDTRRYEYDRWGNRKASYNSLGGLTASQLITHQTGTGQQSEAPTNRIARVTVQGVTANYSYDRAGDVTNDGTNIYTYDVAGRLKTATVGAQVTTYFYDSANRRVQKSVNSSGTITIIDYIWEGGKILAEYDRASGVYTDYVWAGSKMVATIKGTTTTFYHQDRLSTRLSTNATGTVVGTQSHFPFGEDAGGTGTQEKHRFTSYERDSETGTDYAVNRQHDPDTGEFLQPDPVAGLTTTPQTLSRVAYAANNPTSLVDPQGLTTEHVWGLYTAGASLGSGCLIDNATSPCSLAYALLQSGAGVLGPSPQNVAYWNARKGGWDIFHSTLVRTGYGPLIPSEWRTHKPTFWEMAAIAIIDSIAGGDIDRRNQLRFQYIIAVTGLDKYIRSWTYSMNTHSFGVIYSKSLETFSSPYFAGPGFAILHVGDVGFPAYDFRAHSGIFGEESLQIVYSPGSDKGYADFDHYNPYDDVVGLFMHFIHDVLKH